MTLFDCVEILICIGLYIPLDTQILRGTVVQSLATWGLWALLDGIATASIVYQHGNFTAVAIYTCGGVATSLCILKSKKFEWKWFEGVVAATAVICMIVWAISGARNATIASTTAVMIAGGPQIRDAYRKPWESSLVTWIGFLVVNILATIQGKSWTVEERLYPVACTILCFVILMFTAQKLWIPQPVVEKK